MGSEIASGYSHEAATQFKCHLNARHDLKSAKFTLTMANAGPSVAQILSMLLCSGYNLQKFPRLVATAFAETHLGS